MTGLEVMIRTANRSDNVLLAEIGAETFFDSFASDNTPENMAVYLAASFSPAIQAQELADPTSRFLIAEWDGSVVGYARLKVADVSAEVPGQKPIEIVRFYARKPWIGKGIGSALMQACLQAAVSMHCDLIWLGVWEKNVRAIAFYRKWGFKEVGQHDFLLGDERQRDVLMARLVNQG